MQTVGIYTADESSALARALKEGARAAGFQARMRSAHDFRVGDTEDFDLILLTTMRAKGKLILDEYARRVVIARPGRPADWKMPMFVIDYGYLRRVNGVDDFLTGHWQVSRGWLNNIPEFYCPPNRWEALGLEVREKGGDPKGYVLVCGQHVGDPSHGFGEAGLRDWANDMVRRYQDEGRQVVFRPHPDSPHVLPDATLGCRIDSGGRGTIGDALEEAALLVTICSNAGHDALLAGVPAIASMPDLAAWAELSGEVLPSVAQRQRYFQRVAYAQWTIDELRSGEWFKLHELVESQARPFGPAPETSPTVVAPKTETSRPRGRAASNR